MNTRLEIFVNGVWQNLELWNRASIKYNKIVNKIASIDTREISHSNTLSIPPNFHNRSVLGINEFNPLDLARALNSKYEAKYYIEEKLVQEGFVVINRANDKDIKINFIDESLDLTDNWGETKFRDLLNNPSLSIPQDYKDAINEMKTYTLPTNQIASFLSPVGTRGHNLSLFPNNLNCIGSEFMVDKEGDRPDNSFNPFQSRPIFNAKAVFDLATLAYGYTPNYDMSVNWEEVEETYIVPSGLNDNFVDDGITNIFSTINFQNGSIVIDSNPDKLVVLSTPSRSEQPQDLTGWVSPESGWSTNYFSENSIFKPNLVQEPNGVIRYTINHSNGDFTNPSTAYGVWRNTSNNGVVFKPLFIDNFTQVTSGRIQYQISKVQLFDPPTGAGDFVGIISSIETNGNVFNYQITETFLPIESVSYDERGQFESQSIDLTYAAPENTIKELIISLMERFGVLMRIDNTTKEVLFYNYSRYLNKREEGDVVDLSDYILEYEPKEYNTNYGNGFGKLNEIGLRNPFRGNTYFLPLDNQGQGSKLKDFQRNLSKRFRDVSKVNRIPNSITPYTEYENLGLGLVVVNGTVGDLTQVRFVEDPQDGDPTFTTQGVISGVPKIENVRFSFLPIGVLEWYRLVDQAIKANPKFLLPIQLVRNLDLSIPIYIEQMGGFYIIEEISQYENPQKKVIVKVIKLVDGAEWSDDFSDDFDI